jgi:hypothetical protein
MTFRTPLQAENISDENWKLLADLVYEGRDDDFRVPAGFITDFASVPAFMRGIIDDTGKWTKAAVVHDYLLTYRVPHYGVYPGGDSIITSRDADGIFRRIMREESVPFLTRWVMWAGVRVASLFSSNRAYGRAFLADAPKVALAAVPALVLFVPVAALTLVLRWIMKLLHF